MRDRIGSKAMRALDEQRRDEWSRERGRKWVDAFVHRVRAHCRKCHFFDEAFFYVDEKRVVRAECKRFRLHLIECGRRARAGGAVGFAEIERQRDHLVTGYDILFEQDRRIETARIRENDGRHLRADPPSAYLRNVV